MGVALAPYALRFWHSIWSLPLRDSGHEVAKLLRRLKLIGYPHGDKHSFRKPE